MICYSFFPNSFLAYGLHCIRSIINAGAEPNNSFQSKRTRVINISSLIAALLVIIFGGGLTILWGRTEILYPAVPEALLFVLTIWLNYKRKYFYSGLIWHSTFCWATLVFGIMMSAVIDATHMVSFLVGTPILIFKDREPKLLAFCICCSVFALSGIEVNTLLRIFSPLEIPSNLYLPFRVATWSSVLLLNVVVILFYMHQNNLLLKREKKSNSKLKKVNKKLAKVSAYKTIYINETTHELRAPLNALYAISRLLDDPDIKAEDLRKMHKSIGTSVNHSLEIINNVLELAKIESGKTPPTKIERIQVRTWLKEVLSIFAYQASTKNVEIDLRFDEHLPDEISFGRIQVTQVLTNLVSNAIKFSLDGSVIQVSADYGENSWQLVVHDNGIGMSPATLERIFLPFYSEGKNNPHGTGLGMHIAKKITERLGGSLSAESEPGAGSRFTASFPLVPVGSSASMQPGPQSSLVHPVEVLVIDDDKIGAQYFGTLLRKMGCTVSVAYTGSAGLEIAEIAIPDIIIMDVSLPDTNGNVLLQVFKKHPTLSNVPVIFVTGSSYPEDQEEAMRLGADEYILKPVPVSAINRILSKYAQ